VEAERVAQELERVVHRLVDLFDARACESFFGVFAARDDLAGAEQPIAARVLT
jgi:hypothetical protein